MIFQTAFCIFLVAAFTACAADQPQRYFWLDSFELKDTIPKRLQTPPGFNRVQSPENSFADWLRNLPLKPGKSQVMIRHNQIKTIQESHWAAVDIDQGWRNGQQGMGAIFRLWSEYLFFQKRYQEISYIAENNCRMSYFWWCYGYRPDLRYENRYYSDKFWIKNYDHKSLVSFFPEYLKNQSAVFNLKKYRGIQGFEELKIGDIFSTGKFRERSLIVVDEAENPYTGARIFLLAQGGDPNQDLQILVNPVDHEYSPWYKINRETKKIETPEHTYYVGDVMRIWGDKDYLFYPEVWIDEYIDPISR
ncbi:MAG: DUF4846 domain-containing protein [Candidatus Wallbacteria bacterium]|nr:DUF4846 domain-containing protein [Candidatus Wallbacteria bacterium]